MRVFSDTVSLSVFHGRNSHYLLKITVKGTLRLKAHRKIDLGYIAIVVAEHLTSLAYPILVKHRAEARSEIFPYQVGKITRMISQLLRHPVLMKRLRIMLCDVVGKLHGKTVITLTATGKRLISEIFRRNCIK